MDIYYDYENQAWVTDGTYADCGHTAGYGTCICYGRAHEGETPSQDIQARYGVEPRHCQR